MEYKNPYPSAVPHAILAPRNFTISSMFYGCSLVVEGFFLAISVLFFALALYFKIKNHKLLIDQSNNKGPKKDKQNIICEVVAHKDFYDNDEDEESSSQDNKSEEKGNSLQSQLFGGVLRIYERRLVYSATFTIPWAFCVNSFDADIVVVISAAVFMAFIILFNIRRMLPDWKITILIYFLPAIASSFSYIGGTHQLYGWTAVKDPLKLEV